MLQMNIPVGTKTQLIMVLMFLGFRRFREASTTETHSTAWVPTVSGGLLQRARQQMHGDGSWAIATGMCTVTPAIRLTGLVSAVSGIRLFVYFTI